MQTILVPLDGAASSEQVLPFVRLLAPALNARIVLLHVFTDPEHEYAVVRAPGPAPASDGAARWLREQHQRWLAQHRAIDEYLEARAAPLRAAGLTVELCIELGLPAETIVQVAEQQQAALLVLASHGYSRLRRWAAGSIADMVAQRVQVPLLLVRADTPTPPTQLGRILAPLDGSVQARHVLAHALVLAQRTAAELVVLQTHAPAIEDFLQADTTPAAQRETLRAHVLHAYASHFGRESAARARVTAVIDVGNLADTVIAHAAAHPNDIVVLAHPPAPGARRHPGGLHMPQLFRALAAPLLLVPGG